jgi:hypothetical protein
MQILVLGPHRSGTSMVTRLINMMGAYFGPEKSSLGFDESNPKGFWERRDVMRLNDAILHLRGCSWRELAGWDINAMPTLHEELRRDMQLLTLDLDAHRPWVMKDPRLCLTLPCWAPLFEVPVAIIVYRNALETAQSLQKRNRLSIELGLAMWELHAVSLLNASRAMPRIFIKHSELIENPVAAVDYLFEQLEGYEVRGLRMPSAREIMAFVEPELHREKRGELRRPASSPARKGLSDIMRGDLAQQKTLLLSPSAQDELKRSGRKAA